jgi:uncharacterized protein (TIGR03084 family)
MLTPDLREEQQALYSLLEGRDEAFWQSKTQFKDWRVWDIISHLYFSDHMALTAASGIEPFNALKTDMAIVFNGQTTLKDYANNWVGDCSGAAPLGRWNRLFNQMCDTFDAALDDKRFPWFGPDMGVRMFATARQMEVWAHGQAIYDMLGLERENTERIKNIVVIGVKTFGFNFMLRGETPPETMPYLSLTAPSGATWEFGDPSEREIIQGNAAEFAQVVTQTRNIADTNLEVTGDIANRWMTIAQCFAGNPEDPPAAGSRHKATNS